MALHASWNKQVSSHVSVRRGVVVLAACVLVLGHLFVARLQSDRARLVAELDSVMTDLRAHQEALKISRQQCNVQLKRYQAAEEKTEALLNYYREGDSSRQKDWCKKLNENALAEFRVAAQKQLKEVKDEMSRVVKERNELSDRLQPLALCCKSAYSKAQSLMAGATREEALRKASEATRGSARAIEDPHTILRHTQRVEWTSPFNRRAQVSKLESTPTKSGGNSASRASASRSAERAAATTSVPARSSASVQEEFEAVRVNEAESHR